MKSCLLTLTVIAGCATLAIPAFAQTALPQGSATAPTAPRAAVAAPRAVVVVTATSADTRAALRAPGTTTVTAAGNVIVLADGIVANAAIASIRPPAPGFVYEQ